MSTAHTHKHHGHSHNHGRDHHGNPKDFANYLKRLESPERDAWQQPQRVIKALKLGRGDTVAEVGAGPGYISLRLAKAVGPKGRVFAVEVEPKMLAVLGERLVAAKTINLTPVLGLLERPLLPHRSLDHVLLVNTFHHFHDGVAYLKELARCLRPQGRISVVDFHDREMPMGPPPEEKISRDACVTLAKRAGLTLVAEQTFLEYQYFLTFAATARA